MLLEALGSMVIYDVPPNLSARNETVAHRAGVINPNFFSFGMSQIVFLLLPFVVGLIANATDNFILGS